MILVFAENGLQCYSIVLLAIAKNYIDSTPAASYKLGIEFPICIDN